jgi:hypothetical protein
MATLILILKNIAGWCYYHGGTVILALGVLFILIGGSLVYRNCKKQPKIDEKAINVINNGNESRRIEELTKIVEENADVIRTNDNRTTLTEATIEERSAEAEKKVQEVDKKIQEIKNSQNRDVTQEELICLIEGTC